MNEFNRQLIEAASWRVATEIARRYPTEITIIETHPGGGQYDCLSLIYEDRINICDLNRRGWMHVHARCDGKRPPAPYDIWPAILAADDSKAVVDRVNQMMGLAIPDHLPKSVPRTIVYRFITGFLTQAVFGATEWECRSGYADTSGMGGGVREEMFERFPTARELLQTGSKGDSAKRFWFLSRHGDPQLCLETTGRLWTAKGEEANLASLYESKKRIWPVIMAVASNLLP